MANEVGMFDRIAFKYVPFEGNASALLIKAAHIFESALRDGRAIKKGTVFNVNVTMEEMGYENIKGTALVSLKERLREENRKSVYANIIALIDYNAGEEEVCTGLKISITS